MKVTNTFLSFKANKMSHQQAQYLKNILSKSKQVDIICHEATDRDSANSALVMNDYLQQMGINSRIIISQNLESLGIKNSQNIIQANNEEQLNKTPIDTAFCVDFSKDDRISSQTLLRIKKAKNILGLDHHNDFNIVDKDFTYITKPNEKAPIGSFYVDTTAKSATSVVYRFLEAQHKKLDSKTAYRLFEGLVDDCSKKGLIVCNGENKTITPSKKLMEDKNALEIYCKLKLKLNKEQIAQIARKIDIMSSLSKDEKKFKKSLNDKLKFTKNGKIAYIALSPNDEQWKSLGGDNTRTSTILNRFRQQTLKNSNAKAVIAFYEAHGDYRFSIHSKENKLNEFYRLALKTLSHNEFSTGGHSDRGGGKIRTLDEKTCEKFSKEIITYLETVFA